MHMQHGCQCLEVHAASPRSAMRDQHLSSAFMQVLASSHHRPLPHSWLSSSYQQSECGCCSSALKYPEHGTQLCHGLPATVLHLHVPFLQMSCLLALHHLSNKLLGCSCTTPVLRRHCTCYHSRSQLPVIEPVEAKCISGSLLEDLLRVVCTVVRASTVPARCCT